MKEETPARAEAFDAARYDALLAGSPETTLFHTRDWAAVVTRAFPQVQNRTRILRIGERSHALPLYRWQRLGGLLRTSHTSFPFLYGGPVPSTAEAWRAVVTALAAESGSFLAIGNPFGQQRASAPVGLDPQQETTHLLVLPASAEIFWDQILTSRKRNDIRRLTRKGVTIETSREPESVRAVYQLYLKRMGTWRQRPGLIYPLAFYEGMLDLGAERVRLYLARFEERIIGGTFVCHWNGIWHYQAGYFDHDARSLRPNVLLQERIIRDAIDSGARIYDMLPSAGIAAVEEFKESFGGIRTAFPRWERVGRLQRLGQAIRTRLRR